jgi:hypothetical protein
VDISNILLKPFPVLSFVGKNIFLKWPEFDEWYKFGVGWLNYLLLLLRKATFPQAMLTFIQVFYTDGFSSFENAVNFFVTKDLTVTMVLRLRILYKGGHYYEIHFLHTQQSVGFCKLQYQQRLFITQ